MKIQQSYKLNPSASFLIINGGWEVFESSTGKRLEIAAPGRLIGPLLDVLAGKTLTRRALVSDLASCITCSEAEIEAIFPDLLQSTLIIECQEKECVFDKIVYTPWFEYWSRRKTIFHADYSDPAVFDLDKNIMESYFVEPPPSLYKEIVLTQDEVFLHHPAYGAFSSNRGKFECFLFYLFGRLRPAKFLGILPAQFKTLPSKGGRHPFEIYIFSSKNDLCAEGLYHYSVQQHSLKEISNEITQLPQGCFIIVTVIYERYQWRYRDSWAYKDIYLEFGHFSETLKQLARVNQFELEELQQDNFFSVHLPLVEEIMGIYKIG